MHGIYLCWLIRLLDTDFVSVTAEQYLTVITACYANVFAMGAVFRQQIFLPAGIIQLVMLWYNN